MFLPNLNAGQARVVYYRVRAYVNFVGNVLFSNGNINMQQQSPIIRQVAMILVSHFYQHDI